VNAIAERTRSVTTQDKASGARRTFRRDIEGLRAVAVLAVVIYHVRGEWLPGGFIGVDIFFVISGFLITEQLMREQARTGSVRLLRFYARRMVRLIPAAAVVLVATAAATFAFVPRIVWSQFGQDIAASGAYIVNWSLAARSVDYLAEDAAVSPAQHFWSLAVEEQFYLIWPILIISAALWARRRGTTASKPFLVLAVALFIASLGVALVLASAEDPAAYFITTTRLWELAAGGIAAICIASIRLKTSNALIAVLGVVGVVLIAGSLALIHVDSQWPSALTLIPIGGAVLVLLFGFSKTDEPSLTTVALGNAPFVWIGGLSYSLYLWHWPLIVIASYAFDSSGTKVALIAAVISIGAAWLSLRFVENPIRYSAWARSGTRNGLLVGLVGGAVAVLCGAALIVVGPQGVLTKPDGAVAQGASVLSPSIDQTSFATIDDQPEWVTPNPLEATLDVPAIYADGGQQSGPGTEAISRTYGDVDSARVIALVGDSKSVQWLSALDAIGKKEGARVVVFNKRQCAFADAPSTFDGKNYASCTEWNDNVLDELLELKPETVLVSQVNGGAWVPNSTSQEEASALMVDGIVRSLSSLTDAGMSVGVISDNPHPESNVYQCVAEFPETVSECSYEREGAIARSALPTQLAAVTRMGGSTVDGSLVVSGGANPAVSLLDLTDVVCPDPSRTGYCPAIVGNVLVYRQGSHITDTYALTAADRLQAQMVSAGLLSAQKP
jgi:peptidoglycan/LPS O-acetylase OafA/YrhL